MSQDLRRCCSCSNSGFGINGNEGRCRFGQQWNGQKLCPVPSGPAAAPVPGRVASAEPPALSTEGESSPAA